MSVTVERAFRAQDKIFLSPKRLSTFFSTPSDLFPPNIVMRGHNIKSRDTK